MARQIFRFGKFRIDASARELTLDGSLLTLSPKVFDCLAYLIEHRGRAVGRDELIAAVWGKADVSDTLLGQTILKARRAVGDDGNEQSAIRTVPRFGYRWIAPLEADDVTDDTAEAEAPRSLSSPDFDATEPPFPSAAATPAASVSPASTQAARPSTRARFAVVAAAAVLGLLAVSALWLVVRSQHTPSLENVAAPTAATAPPVDATAVLPVEVAAGADWTWLRLGLMDLVATRLRNGGEAVVPANNVVALVRGDSTDTVSASKRVRNATGARFIVLPIASRNGNDWIVRLQLRSPDGTDREVEARSPDVIEAGRAAADRLLAVLGKRAGTGLTDASDTPIAELLSRAEAALLTDDLDGARRLLESAPAAAQTSPELRLRLAQIDFRAGQLDRAQQRLDLLLKEVPAETQPVLRARILNGAGAVAARQDRNTDAEHDFSEAIALLENRNQPAWLGQAYTGRGIAYAQEARLDPAAADLSRARIALELAGDTLALARVEANEGVVDAKRGRFADALVAHQRAAQRFERFGALNEFVLTLANVADAQLALLQPADALATTDRAWPALERLENQATRYSFQVTRADVLAENGRLLQARALLHDLTAALPTSGDPALQARAETILAQLDLDFAQSATAIALASAAVAALATPDYVRERADAWLVLTRALRAQGRDRDAATESARFSAWANTEPSPAPLYAALAEAEQHWSDRDLEAARSSYDRALQLAEQQAVPGDTAVLVVSYGSTLIADGDLQHAAGIVGQVARWADRDFNCALLQVRLYHALGHADAWQEALRQARSLAGERSIPAPLATPPKPALAAKNS